MSRRTTPLSVRRWARSSRRPGRGRRSPRGSCCSSRPSRRRRRRRGGGRIGGRRGRRLARRALRRVLASAAPTPDEDDGGAEATEQPQHLSSCPGGHLELTHDTLRHLAHVPAPRRVCCPMCMATSSVGSGRVRCGERKDGARTGAYGVSGGPSNRSMRANSSTGRRESFVITFAACRSPPLPRLRGCRGCRRSGVAPLPTQDQRREQAAEALVAGAEQDVLHERVHRAAAHEALAVEVVVGDRQHAELARATSRSTGHLVERSRRTRRDAPSRAASCTGDRRVALTDVLGRERAQPLVDVRPRLAEAEHVVVAEVLALRGGPARR